MTKGKLGVGLFDLLEPFIFPEGKENRLTGTPTRENQWPPRLLNFVDQPAELLAGLLERHHLEHLDHPWFHRTLYLEVPQLPPVDSERVEQCVPDTGYLATLVDKARTRPLGGSDGPGFVASLAGGDNVWFHVGRTALQNRHLR